MKASLEYLRFSGRNRLREVIGIFLLGIPPYIMDRLWKHSGLHDLTYVLLFLPVSLGSYRFGVIGGIVYSLLYGVGIYWNDKNFTFNLHEFLSGNLNIIELFVTAFLLASGVSTGILASKLRAQREDIEKANQKLKEMSFRDPLTGMGNSRAFWENLERCCEQALELNQPMALVIADIDNFKKFNDTLGHLEGDALLAQVSEIIRANVRAADFPCRYGGDEMGIILPNCDRDMAESVVSRLMVALGTFFLGVMKDRGIRVSISIGIAVLPEDGISPRALVAAADRAMYKAKQIPGNYCCFASPNKS